MRAGQGGGFKPAQMRAPLLTTVLAIGARPAESV